MKGNENVRWCFAFAQIVDCCHITAYVLQLLTSNKRYLRRMQLEVNNLMSPGRNWFEPNGSGLSQLYMHVLALNSWLGLGRFILVYWGERLVLLWDEEVGSSHVLGAAIPLGLVLVHHYPLQQRSHPPTALTGPKWALLPGLGTNTTSTGSHLHLGVPVWGQQTDAIGFGTQSIHSTFLIQFNLPTPPVFPLSRIICGVRP